MQEISFYETDLHGAAYSTVAPDYSGPCALQCIGVGGRRAPRVVFPDAAEARSAAKFAVSWMGGYDRAEVTEAREETPTHLSWVDWM